MVLTVSFVLPGDRALLPPSPCGLKVLSSPVEPNEPPQDLTPASRRQDHTTSPYAATSLVRSLGDRSQAFRQPALQSRRAQNAAASTASAPRVRDDRDTPLWWGGMREVLEVIWGEWEWKYFCKGDSTQTCPAGKSPDGVESKFSRVPHEVQRSSRCSATSNSAPPSRPAEF